MATADLINLLTKLKVDRTHGPGALYQPITLLWAISRASGEDGDRLAPWRETREQIAGLVECYGRPSEEDRIHQPLSALYRAGLWDLGPDASTLPNSHEEKWFKECQPDSGLVSDVYGLLRKSAEARAAAVRAMVPYFEEAPHEGLLLRLGLSESPSEQVLGRELAAEYRRLCARADAFWENRKDKRAPRMSNDPVRSGAAREAVILRSKGRCENPDCNGDIKDVTVAGRPLLEVDHVKDLAKDGDDNPFQMIALCPNCHTIKTHGRTREELTQKLFVVAKRLHEQTWAEG